MQNLATQADKFELPGNIHYLNGAFMSPQLKSVTAIGLESVQKKALPFNTSIDDFFNDTEKIRREYSKLINNKEPNRIVLIPSVSYGMANVTHNIELKGREVVVAGEQFPSNVYPWMSAAKQQGGELKIVDPPQTTEQRGEKWNQLILEAINENTAVLAISQVHWADGTKFDLVAMRKRTKEVGALLIIDGTQSVGAHPFDLEEIQPDALICAGYKWLLGPYGLGMAYYGEYFDNAMPIEENWINRLNSEDFSGLIEYEETYQPGALRFEMGEHSSFVLVPMLLESLKQLNEWQPDRIQTYCKSIVDDPLQRLQEAGFWVEDEAWRANHLFGIRHAEMPIEKIKAAFAERNIFVSYRGSAIRVAPYVHNTIEDLNVMTEVLLESIIHHA
ncbi:MAG: aminotransferase [Bacteroidetes bacterium]|nr:MAG: aminotransferase [Bacteroidota bacterium]